MSPKRIITIPISAGVNTWFFTIQINPPTSAIEYLIGGDVIHSFDRYEKCHAEDWNFEQGEEVPICPSCGRPIDTPAVYNFAPLHM
ncbi:hypothetical protein TKK_0017151 [Trichogramma kaykai]|uniref:Uncharacterized protein n=1 Tax=Trichogramma kaykai TaxID=54128 RepID=A0ABD2W5W2_9HYME